MLGFYRRFISFDKYRIVSIFPMTVAIAFRNKKKWSSDISPIVRRVYVAAGEEGRGRCDRQGVVLARRPARSTRRTKSDEGRTTDSGQHASDLPNGELVEISLRIAVEYEPWLLEISMINLRANTETLTLRVDQ
ncbi:hypothetical protein FOCC_FOCC014299 [Frankliniella occidentalis]|nr:hypothetical protein FOCC_FOCC014299 [Frankliniella occidentalis]